MKAYGLKHKKIATELGFKIMNLRNNMLEDLFKAIDSFEELTPKDAMAVFLAVQKGFNYRVKVTA